MKLHDFHEFILKTIQCMETTLVRVRSMLTHDQMCAPQCSPNCRPPEMFPHYMPPSLHTHAIRYRAVLRQAWL